MDRLVPLLPIVALLAIAAAATGVAVLALDRPLLAAGAAPLVAAAALYVLSGRRGAA